MTEAHDAARIRTRKDNGVKKKPWMSTSTEFLSVPGLARYLGIPYNTVLKMVKTSVIPGAFQIGKRLMFRTQVVEQWRRGTL